MQNSLKEKTLPEKSVLALRIKYSIFLFIVAFLCGSLAVFSGYLSIIVLLISLVVGLYVICFYAKRRSLSVSYSFDEKYFVISKGVYFCNNIQIRLSQVQYIDKITTLIQKMLGLCNLVFCMTGTKISLENISLEDAQQILKEVKCYEKG
ncbi:MAG: PH domain-containing protein [Oscillospiraceae bacterium]|jgi:membrane protein YdbS with pleckstrin-like domain|nr:PH domain-containing protein [Oscillospiraceae bacterium]